MTDVQVLEFELSAERYCVEIDYVAEIVDRDDLTPIPNAPSHVEGVMDLRGRTTSIVDPKEVLGVDDPGDGRRILVFDPDETPNGEAIGWIVDAVDQVARISPDDVEDSPSDDAAVRGIVQRNGEFVIWVSPETINA